MAMMQVTTKEDGWFELNTRFVETINHKKNEISMTSGKVYKIDDDAISRLTKLMKLENLY